MIPIKLTKCHEFLSVDTTIVFHVSDAHTDANESTKI
jgi:hypothetical protein